MSAGRNTAATPLKVSAAEADAILEQISTIALSTLEIAIQVVEDVGNDPAAAGRAYALQMLVQLMGALADQATSTACKAEFADWFLG